MANWVTKYRLEFSDIYQIVSQRSDWQIDFMFDGYDGGITDLTGAADPLIITHGEDTDDRTKAMIGSTAQINITITSDDFPKEDFFQIEGYQIKVVVYKNSTIFWQGFVVPDYCEYPYTSAPYYFSIQATDGISDLKSINADLSSMLGHGIGEADEVKILEFLISYGLWKAQDGEVQKTTIMSSFTADHIKSEPLYNNILDEAYVKAQFFQDQNSPAFGRTVYECIEIISRSLGYRIFLERDGFWVQQYADMGFDITEADVYSPSKSKQPIQLRQILKSDIASGNVLYRNNDARITIYPPYKTTVIDVDYIPRSWLKNYSWTQYQEDSITGHFEDWETVIYNNNNDTPYYDVWRGGSGNEGDPYYAILRAYDGEAGLYQDIPIDSASNMGVSIDFDITFVNTNTFAIELFALDENKQEIGYYGSSHAGGGRWTPPYWQWKDLEGSSYAPHSEGSRWLTGRGDADDDGRASVSFKTNGYEWSPIAQTNEVKYLRFIIRDPYSGTSASTKTVHVFPVNFNITYGFARTGEVDTYKSKKRFVKKYDVDSAELLTATPSETNTVYMREEINPLYTIFSTKAGGITSHLQYMNLYLIGGMHSRSFEIMKGSFVSNTLEFHHVIQRAFGKNKLFMQMYDEYHVRSCEHTMTLAEVWPFDVLDPNDPAYTLNFYNDPSSITKYKTK